MSKTFKQLVVQKRLSGCSPPDVRSTLNMNYLSHVAAALLEIEEHERMFWKFLVEFPETVNYWISKLEAKCYMLNALCFRKISS